ncbi:DEAD/DEAH box helicase [Frankia sp. QA3]|uniref:DEAD/DEAH box helicase n=1 Tax=Frankia sp. QA3 TaxID=710111 RepID=UPI0012F924CF|nr:DEAD/DEAH box helicase [Frankia sp. QA3]
MDTAPIRGPDSVGAYRAAGYEGGGGYVSDGPRLRRRFTWDEVEPGLLREMLGAVYTDSGRSEDAERLARLGGAELSDWAQRVLGPRLNPRHLQVNALVDVLRDRWLLHADPAVVRNMAEMVQLSLSGEARTARLDSTAERIAFLRRRNRTNGLRASLRAGFLEDHRRAMPVRGEETPAGERDGSSWLLVGEGRDDPRTPFPFQRSAWRKLDELARGVDGTARSGLLVLPTGAGKTYTAVRWLLDRMYAERQLRVLWIADQQELVEQAARTMVELARGMPVSFERVLRRIHNNASPPTSLADPDLDVAVVTRASLAGGRAKDAARKRLARFLERPCVVVVDEAHHAVAPTYAELLDFVTAVADPVLVGLTATPWPSGAGAAKRLRDRFPVRVVDLAARDLMGSGVLARPVFHTVDTGERPELTDDERRLLGDRDLPPAVLRRLDQEHRNRLVVDTWLARREQWGKTLVFAVDIEHAERLGALFSSRGAQVQVVHSRSMLAREVILEWFRKEKGSCVLVSVGMLTEGVDLPDARTALLSRPTRSRVLMHQMVGRVLRGTESGGDDLAHVVDLRDRWDDGIDVLAPLEIPISEAPAGGMEGTGYRLPRVPDEVTGQPIPQDVLYRVLRSYAERIGNHTGLVPMTSTVLVGYYELGEVNVPVCEHTRERFTDLIDIYLNGTKPDSRSPVDLFDDLPVPRPVRADVRAVVDYVKTYEAAPPFVDRRAVFSVRTVAEALLDLPAMTVRQRQAWLRNRYENGLASIAVPSFQSFCEAVEQEAFSLSERAGRDFNPEHVAPSSSHSRGGRVPLVRLDDRDLPTLLRGVVTTGQSLLAEEGELVELLRFVPPVEWTRKPIRHAWAYWSPRIGGRFRGTPVIRVNRLLCVPPEQVPDAVLEFLLWHELLHHLLPGQGHNGEFRRLEALWPDSDLHDHALGSLLERFRTHD